MTKQEPVTMIENAGFEAVERDTVYNRVDTAKAGKFVIQFCVQ